MAPVEQFVSHWWENNYTLKILIARRNWFRNIILKLSVISDHVSFSSGFLTKNIKFENALTCLFPKIVSSDFQDFLLDSNSSISGVFCDRRHSRRVHCTTIGHCYHENREFIHFVWWWLSDTTVSLYHHSQAPQESHQHKRPRKWTN